MGWNITLATERSVTEEEINACVEKLPQGWGGFGRQKWGWSLAVDIRLNDGQVNLSGSYGMSGKIAYPFAEFMARLLRERGHEVTVGEIN